jgi:hypothetical protein
MAVGHHQHVVMAIQFEFDVRREIRQQSSVGVVGHDLHRVGDDVLGHRGVQANLAHLARNDSPGNAATVNVTGWPRVQSADVCLVHRHPDLNTGEVLGDQEKAGGIHARNDGLTDIDASVNDDTVDRRFDRGVAEIALACSSMPSAWARLPRA